MSDKEKEVKFESLVPDGYFQCECAVFPVGGDNSLCYTTSKERADWIVERLNRPADPAVAELVEALKQIVVIRNAPHTANAAGKCSDMHTIALHVLAKHKL